jgi:hypothetical protein
MRPRLRVRFPWNLRIEDNCWIREGAWIHNQGLVTIESNAVVSQEAFITTGSHDIYRSMGLIIKPVVIRHGAWVTSRCIVLQGVEVGQNTVATPEAWCADLCRRTASTAESRPPLFASVGRRATRPMTESFSQRPRLWL